MLGSAFLGVQASTGEPLWDVMARMSKSGKIVYPSEDKDEMRLFEVKYKVFLDMADSQRRYRAAVDKLDEGI